MDGRRLAIMIAVGLVLGGAVFAIILLTLSEPELPPRQHPANEPLAAPPALAAVDAALLVAPVTAGKPAAFMQAGKTVAMLPGRMQVKAADLEFTSGGRYLVAIESGRVCVLDWQAQTEVSAQSHAGGLIGLALQPDGRGAWTTEGSGRLRWWPISENGQIGASTQVGADLGSMLQVAASANGSLVATVSYGGVLSLWDARARKQLSTVTTPLPLRHCVFSPDGARLIVGTNTNMVYDYQLSTGQGRTSQIMPVAQDIDLMCMGVSADGRHFSTGHTQPWVTVWESQSMTYRHWLKCPEHAIINLAYAPDSSLIALALGDKKIYLWNPDTPAEDGQRAVLTGHAGNLVALAFSPDGSTLACADDSGTILLWAAGK